MGDHAKAADATVSKPADAKAEARKVRILYGLSVGAAFNCTSWFMMIPARPAMIALFNDDPAFVASIMGGMTSGASLFEFLLTPFLGALSDQVGRRPVMLGTTAVCTLARAVTFACGDVSLKACIYANWFDRCFSGSAFPLFLTTGRAAATDIYKESGDDSVMTGLGTAVHSIVGAALIVSPTVGTFVMDKGGLGHPKYTAALASLVSLAQLCYTYTSIEETAPNPQPLSSVTLDTLLSGLRRKGNPFSFFAYFGIGRSVAGLMVAFGLQSLPIEMHDMRMTLTRTLLKFTNVQTAQMLMALGVGTLFGGVAAKKSMAALGDTLHNVIASISHVGAQMCWAFAKTPALVNFSGLLFLLGGSAVLPIRTSLIKTILAERPNLQGGEIQGALANMVGLTKIIMPQGYARLFQRFGQRGPFFFASAAIIAGTAVFMGCPKGPLKVTRDKKKAAAADKTL